MESQYKTIGGPESDLIWQYSQADLLGHGAFAIVYKGHNARNISEQVAIKVIQKKNLEKTKSLMIKEIGILRVLKHDNIVSLLDCQESRRELYLIMEYCNASDLSDFMKQFKKLSEQTVQVITYQLAQAMQVLWKNGILHRDLKPQNILLHKIRQKIKNHDSDNSSNCSTPPISRKNSKNANNNEKSVITPSSSKNNLRPEKVTAQDFIKDNVILKLADFGFARQLRLDSMAATLCGSPMYMAPEVITSQKYTAKADLWSIGVIIYQALTARAPFPQPNPPALRDFYNSHTNIKAPLPEGISTCLRDLINGLLEKNVERRISFEKFFKHPFIKSYEEQKARRDADQAKLEKLLLQQHPREVG